jgi:hypothetical protein
MAAMRYPPYPLLRHLSQVRILRPFGEPVPGSKRMAYAPYISLEPVDLA